MIRFGLCVLAVVGWLLGGLVIAPEPDACVLRLGSFDGPTQFLSDSAGQGLAGFIHGPVFGLGNCGCLGEGTGCGTEVGEGHADPITFGMGG